MDSQTTAQWIALGGATLLLLALLRFAAAYQGVMTAGRDKRIRDLEVTVERLDKELWVERQRCDSLSRRLANLEERNFGDGKQVGLDEALAAVLMELTGERCRHTFCWRCSTDRPLVAADLCGECYEYLRAEGPSPPHPTASLLAPMRPFDR